MPDLQTRTFLRTKDAERRIADLDKSIRRRGRWELRAYGSTTFPFETINGTAALKVKVLTGNIIWHNSLFIIYDSITPDTTLACPEITLTDDANNYIYLTLDDEFAPNTATVTCDTTGWSGYPAQPNAPSRKYCLLSTVVTSGGAISSITIAWKGHLTWPSIYGFWA